MRIYIIGFLASALFPLALAAYGGHLAAMILEKNKKIKAMIIVWTLASLGVIASGIQQYWVYKENISQQSKLNEENEALQSKLNNISQNIQTVRNAQGKTEKAILSFSFYPKPLGKLIKDIVASSENGVFSVSFTAKNISRVSATNGYIWIQNCVGCKFAIEPEGTETIPMQGNEVRGVHFNTLHAGTHINPINLKIIPPSVIGSFAIGLKYACDQCPSVDTEHLQMLVVKMINSTSP